MAKGKATGVAADPSIRHGGFAVHPEKGWRGGSRSKKINFDKGAAAENLKAIYEVLGRARVGTDEDITDTGTVSGAQLLFCVVNDKTIPIRERIAAAKELAKFEMAMMDSKVEVSASDEVKKLLDSL